MAALKRNKEKPEALELLLHSAAGVQSVEMNLLTGSVMIYCDQQVTGHSALLAMLKGQGFLLERHDAARNTTSAHRSTLHQSHVGTMLAAAVGTFLIKKVADHAFEALVASLL